MGASRLFDRIEAVDDPDAARAPRVAPGKVALTARLPPRAAPVVQRRADGTGATVAGPVADIAAAGVAGAGARLPYFDQVQAAFGAHLLGDVRVASDPAAAAASRRLGASAYAFGEAIATTGPLDLHTAAHEAAHVIQQRAGIQLDGGMSSPGDASEREADAIADAVVAGRSAVDLLDAIAARGAGASRAVQRDVHGTGALHPEACPTYEMWLAQFRDLPTFHASDGRETSDPTATSGRRVLGDAPADRSGALADRNDPSPTATHDAVGRGAGDRFIDHPTDAWVQANLPEELRVTAYQLPTDCADIAAVLRHVWLNAHGRSERHTIHGAGGGTRRVTLGAGLGPTVAARRERIGTAIAGGRNSGDDAGERPGVSSANAAELVQQYRDAAGTPVLDWAGVSRRLHPGDVVVWEHRRRSDNHVTGGHVQTVRTVGRQGGVVVSVSFVAGNQPLGAADAEAICAAHPSETRAGGMTVSDLRSAPGRRLEVQEAHNLGNVDEGNTPRRWGGVDNDTSYTVVIAVGPPAGAAPARRAGAPVRASDWTPRLAAARDAAALQATFEAALAETRAAIEAGDAVPDDQLAALGAAAATRAATLDPTGALRATLLEVTEAMAAAPGSTEDDALHDATSGPDANSAGPRLPVVRTAFAFIRAALTDAADATATPAAQLADLPLRLDAAPDQAALDRLWGQALDAVVSAGASATHATVTAIGRHGGERVWALARARAAAGPADRGIDHYDAVYGMRDEIVARRGGAPIAVVDNLDVLDHGFDDAARGMSTVDWSRVAPAGVAPGAAIRHVLITGFDPYTGGPVAPAATDWNPSGAAVMRLDGQALAVGADVVAIEGVVYPVSFEQFGRGGVEALVGREAATADAIITVSMDPNRAAAAGAVPVIERYTVGVHGTSTLTPHPTRTEPMPAATVRIPATRHDAGGAPVHADPVIDAGHRDAAPAHATDLDGIARDAGVEVRDNLTFRFAPADLARAQAAFGASAGPDPRGRPGALEVTDDATAAAIVREIRGGFGGAHAGGDSPAVDFHVGGQAFHAELIAGPGGSFLSNEVGYRTQRELAARGAGADAFHVHTADQSTDIDTLVAQLRAVIRETIERRQAAGRAPASADVAS